MKPKKSMEISEGWAIGSGARVDREAAVIRGVKLLGERSVNVNGDGSNNVYPEAARVAAIPLYEGVAVNIDHRPRGSREPRSLRDRIGHVSNVENRKDGLYGDVSINPKHSLAEQVLWDAEHAPSRLGMSHVGTGMGRTKGKDRLIESIQSVESVDIVADPATTRGLFEGCSRPARRLREGADAGAAQKAVLAVLSDQEAKPQDRVRRALAIVAAHAMGKDLPDYSPDAGDAEENPEAPAEGEEARRAAEIYARNARESLEARRAREAQTDRANRAHRLAVLETPATRRARELVEERARYWKNRVVTREMFKTALGLAPNPDNPNPIRAAMERAGLGKRGGKA